MKEVENLVLSVDMITYKHENYIAEAIQGVLMQETNFEFELIIADDCSPDRTQEIVEQIVKLHPRGYRIKYFRHKQNIGMQANGLFAVNKCKGKYFAMCEGDDYWTDPNKLQKQVDFLEENNDYALVFTDLDFYYQTSGIFKRSIFQKKIKPLYYSFEEHLVHAGFLAPCTWLCRKEFVPTFTKKYTDGTFPWLLDVLANSKIKFFNDTTAVYRILDESASHSGSIERRYHFAKGVFEIQKEYLEKYNQPIELRNDLYRKAYAKLLPSAIVLGCDSFIVEAQLFFGQNQLFLKEKCLYQLSFFKNSKHLFKILYRLKGKK